MPTTLHYSIVPYSTAEHLFKVAIEIPASEHSTLTLSLPAWIPGSYMIRDFAQHIHCLQANKQDGNKVLVEQLDKQTWTIHSNGEACIVNYEVFAFDLSVRGAYLFDEYAFFNGTSTFLEVSELNHANIELCVINNQVDNKWRLATSLRKKKELTNNQKVLELLGVSEEDSKLTSEFSSASSSAPTCHNFSCEDYQELIDHPVLLGQFEQHSFDVNGVTFHFVLSGRNETNIERICQDLRPICEHHMDMFGGFPEKEYWFITLLTVDGFGGLEHRASTALMYPRFHLPTHEQLSKHPEKRTVEYQRYLSLCSHELFHTWHVKRSKPEVMIKPALQNEAYMEQLWIYEGFTSLFDDLSLLQTKLANEEEYLTLLGQAITRLIRTQGRHKQSITESSFNAWTKFYKQDANSHNHIVSYYNKGAIVALCLDITIRQLSSNKHSLKDLVVLIWQHYGSKNIGTHNNVVQDLCQQYFGIDVKAFLDLALYSTVDLPLSQLLESIGLKLHFRARQNIKDMGGKESASVIKHGFGATYRNQDSGVVISTVQDRSPASRAGLQVGDILISMNEWQVNESNLQAILDNQKPSTCSIIFLRQGRVVQSSLPVESAIFDTAYLSICDDTLFSQWLG